MPSICEPTIRRLWFTTSAVQFARCNLRCNQLQIKLSKRQQNDNFLIMNVCLWLLRSLFSAGLLNWDRTGDRSWRNVGRCRFSFEVNYFSVVGVLPILEIECFAISSSSEWARNRFKIVLTNIDSSGIVLLSPYENMGQKCFLNNANCNF